MDKQTFETAYRQLRLGKSSVRTKARAIIFCSIANREKELSVPFDIPDDIIDECQRLGIMLTHFGWEESEQSEGESVEESDELFPIRNNYSANTLYQIEIKNYPMFSKFDRKH